MKTRIFVLFLAALFSCLEAAAQHPGKRTFADQNEILFQRLQKVHDLNGEQMKKIRAVFKRSRFMGQGNPAIAEHAASEESCEQKLRDEQVSYENPEFEKICGAKYMAPLHDPTTRGPEDASACIDRFEFPNIPCAWPVVWARASEAATICEILGKRLCDAHEWESACEGRLAPPDYRFDIAKKRDPKTAIQMMRKAHNRKYAGEKTWSYGNAYKKGICAAAGRKSPKCGGGSWSQ